MRPALGPVCLALMLAGCGGSDPEAGRVLVNGRLTQDGGKPFMIDPAKLPLPKGATGLPPGEQLVYMTLLPVGGPGDEPATVNPDGTFTVGGLTGAGVKPGKYKVVLSIGPMGTDALKGRFSREKSSLVVDIEPGKELVIDIGKP